MEPRRQDRPSVLLVDDRPENLIALAAVLAPLDLHIVRAGSGEAALRALLDRDFAVVILDVQMPGMDGFETAEYIRRRPRSRLTPIIFLSAVNTEGAHVTRGYASGAVDYMSKPFEPEVMRSKVTVFAELERERRARQRSQSMLLGAMRSSPNGLAIVDPDGTVVHTNPAIAELVGRGTDTVQGADLATLLGLSRDAELVTRMRELFLTPRARLEAELVVGAGVPVRVVASISSEEDPHLLIELWDLRGRLEEERARIALLSEQAARAEAEALYSRERELATTLQRGLLPLELPEIPGVTLAAFCAAGDEDAQVGGDWFDAFALPGGRVGLVVGDVSGRGVAAAARMSQLRSVARAYAMEGRPPAEVIERLNTYHQILAPDDMTTLVYAILEPDRGRARIANAGHLPPAVVLPGSAPRLVEGSCAALGVVEVCECDEITIAFPADAVLVLYTDGLVERRSAGVQSGTTELLHVLAEPVPDARTACRRVLDACGTAADDDVTVLCATAAVGLGTQISLTLLPEPTSLGAARRLLRRWLTEVGADPQQTSDLVLAANEAWQNAMEHGNGFAPRPVQVELTRTADEVVIRVRDGGGRGMPPGDPDRGRGIALMRAHVDEVELDLGTARGGTVVLRHRIAGPSGEAAGRGDVAPAVPARPDAVSR